MVCSPMEEECGVPKNYFDYVYSVYGIGWATDLEQTFSHIASYLKNDGVFIFSWSHPIHKCVITLWFLENAILMSPGIPSQWMAECFRCQTAKCLPISMHWQKRDSLLKKCWKIPIEADCRQKMKLLKK